MNQVAQQSIDKLRRFAQPRQRSERCELCSQPLADEHQHLVEPPTRRLLCACDACAVLFGHNTQTRYRRVPRSGRRLSRFQLTDNQWKALDVPIGLAFFFYSSPAERVVAVYPSPAGPNESLLDPHAWDDLVRDNPLLEQMTPDVEALLANRIAPAHQYYIAPIDACYQLGGLLRLHWTGISGGTVVWQHIEQFFARLNSRARQE